jgi:tetratricopeptide (TPR) repeat protein
LPDARSDQFQRHPSDFSLNRRIDGDAYDRGKQLWLKQVDAHGDDVELLDRAANYLLLDDRDQAEQLWKKAERLDPANPHWPERLAHLYSLGISSRNGVDRDAAGKALSAMERAKTVTKGNDFNLLISLAKMAYAAGELDKALEYAEKLLQQAREHVGQWNYGNAIHDANSVLGRLALQAGDVDRAKQFLLAAGKTPGSPQLNSFGPNVSLASELAQKGETEIVLNYFELCRAFWKSGAERLDRWTDALRNGRTPDFGANLRY